MNNIKEQLSGITQQVLDGLEDPLKFYAEFKMLEKHLKDCIGQIEDGAMNEFTKYGEKQVNAFGFQMSFKNGSKRYDFKHIKKWNFMKQEMKQFEEKLINKLENTDGFSEDTGEVYEDLPKKTHSKDSIIIKQI